MHGGPCDPRREDGSSATVLGASFRGSGWHGAFMEPASIKVRIGSTAIPPITTHSAMAQANGGQIPHLQGSPAGSLLSVSCH